MINCNIHNDYFNNNNLNWLFKLKKLDTINNTDLLMYKNYKNYYNEENFFKKFSKNYIFKKNNNIDNNKNSTLGILNSLYGGYQAQTNILQRKDRLQFYKNLLKNNNKVHMNYLDKYLNTTNNIYCSRPLLLDSIYLLVNTTINNYILDLLKFFSKDIFYINNKKFILNYTNNFEFLIPTTKGKHYFIEYEMNFLKNIPLNGKKYIFFHLKGYFLENSFPINWKIHKQCLNSYYHNNFSTNLIFYISSFINIKYNKIINLICENNKMIIKNNNTYVDFLVNYVYNKVYTITLYDFVTLVYKLFLLIIKKLKIKNEKFFEKQKITLLYNIIVFCFSSLIFYYSNKKLKLITYINICMNINNELSIDFLRLKTNLKNLYDLYNKCCSNSGRNILFFFKLEYVYNYINDNNCHYGEYNNIISEYDNNSFYNNNKKNFYGINLITANKIIKNISFFEKPYDFYISMYYLYFIKILFILKIPIKENKFFLKKSDWFYSLRELKLKKCNTYGMYKTCFNNDNISLERPYIWLKNKYYDNVFLFLLSRIDFIIKFIFTTFSFNEIYVLYINFIKRKGSKNKFDYAKNLNISFFDMFPELKFIYNVFLKKYSNIKVNNVTDYNKYVYKCVLEGKTNNNYYNSFFSINEKKLFWKSQFFLQSIISSNKNNKIMLERNFLKNFCNAMSYDQYMYMNCTNNIIYYRDHFFNKESVSEYNKYSELYQSNISFLKNLYLIGLTYSHFLFFSFYNYKQYMLNIRILQTCMLPNMDSCKKNTIVSTSCFSKLENLLLEIDNLRFNLNYNSSGFKVNNDDIKVSKNFNSEDDKIDTVNKIGISTNYDLSINESIYTKYYIQGLFFYNPLFISTQLVVNNANILKNCIYFNWFESYDMNLQNLFFFKKKINCSKFLLIDKRSYKIDIGNCSNEIFNNFFDFYFDDVIVSCSNVFFKHLSITNHAFFLIRNTYKNSNYSDDNNSDSIENYFCTFYYLYNIHILKFYYLIIFGLNNINGVRSSNILLGNKNNDDSSGNIEKKFISEININKYLNKYLFMLYKNNIISKDKYDLIISRYDDNKNVNF